MFARESSFSHSLTSIEVIQNGYIGIRQGNDLYTQGREVAGFFIN
jgi:trehalose/maltose hydrolase-like predicted phosphorylase